MGHCPDCHHDNISVIKLEMKDSLSSTGVHLDVPTFSPASAVNYSSTIIIFFSFALLHSRKTEVGTEMYSNSIE